MSVPVASPPLSAIVDRSSIRPMAIGPTVQRLDALGEVALGLEVVFVDFLETAGAAGKVRAITFQWKLCASIVVTAVRQGLIQRTAYFFMTFVAVDFNVMVTRFSFRTGELRMRFGPRSDSGGPPSSMGVSVSADDLVGKPRRFRRRHDGTCSATAGTMPRPSIRACGPAMVERTPAEEREHAYGRRHAREAAGARQHIAHEAQPALLGRHVSTTPPATSMTGPRFSATAGMKSIAGTP